MSRLVVYLRLSHVFVLQHIFQMTFPDGKVTSTLVDEGLGLDPQTPHVKFPLHHPT